MRVYLDNCCFNRPYDDQTQERVHLESLAKLYIQQLIVDGKIHFVWSFILAYENSRNPYTLRRDAIHLFSQRSVEFVDINQEKEVVYIAKDVIKSGIKEKDALHLACAINSSCNYFITTDDRLLKFSTNKIKIVEPIQFIKDMEDFL